MSGAGTCGDRDSTPSAATSRPGLALPSGYHMAGFASSASVRTPARSVPEGVTFALRTAVGVEAALRTSGPRLPDSDNDSTTLSARAVRMVRAPMGRVGRRVLRSIQHRSERISPLAAGL